MATFNDLIPKINPSMTASIREAECIGCTKCIQACPFDSIIGAAKLMHTVIRDACTGCELCIPPCPVDCIDMVEIPEKSSRSKNEFLLKFQDRFEKRNARLLQDKKTDDEKYLETKKTLSLEKRKEEIKRIMTGRK